MIYIEEQSTDCYFNLALEEYVFTSLNPSEDYFLLWRNDNTIVVGRHQNTIEEINGDYVKEHGIHVVRRLTGGGAVYHDLGNLNFTFVAGRENRASFDFGFFTRPVIRALASLGVKAEFNSRNDLVIAGRKFSGNSQFVRGDRVLHHGTLLFSSDLDVVSRALRVKEDKIASKAVKSVRAHVTNISQHTPGPITMEDLKNALLLSVSSGTKLTRRALTKADLAAVNALRAEKYGTWEWNFGNSPAFHLRKERRFAGGGVTVFVQAARGRISALRFRGDFFGAENLSPLEEGLKGVPLEAGALSRALSRLNAASYFERITNQELLELILG